MKHDKKLAMTEYGCTVGAGRRAFMLSDGVSMKYPLATGLLLAALCASAATNYVVPWYANPVSTNVTYDVSLVNDPTDGVLAAKITTAWATVSGADALSGKTAAVKTMGDTTYFRPKFYVLCTDGDIVEFTMTKDLSSAVWTNTLVAADLATTASASGAATDLKVSDDGRLAFLLYGAEWKAVANTPPVWELRIVDNDGALVSNPDTAAKILNAGKNADGCAYITDGRRELYCWRENWTRLGIGAKGSDTDGNAWKNETASEVLDFSHGYAKLANEALQHDNQRFDRGQPYELYAYRPRYLGRTATVREPRIFIESPCLNYFYYNRGTWSGTEEVVLDNATAQPAAYFMKYPECVRKLVVDLPNQMTFGDGWLANGVKPSDRPQVLSETSFDDIRLTALTNLVNYALNGLAASGRLDLPAIRRFQDPDSNTYFNSALGQNPYLTEVSLSAENKTLEYVCDGLFNAFAMKGSNIFRGCGALQDVVFTGGVPTLDDVEYAFPDTAEKQLVFAVPAEDAAWLAKLEGKVALLRRSQQDAFRALHPDRPVPHGIVAPDVFKTHHPQYVAFFDKPKIVQDSGFVILFR